jgi:hypothetical protein
MGVSEFVNAARPTGRECSERKLIDRLQDGALRGTCQLSTGHRPPLRMNLQMFIRAASGTAESSTAKLVLDRHLLREYFFTRAT